MLLGNDVGTTHCKAGTFSLDGRLAKLATRPTVARHAQAGYAYYDPDEQWGIEPATNREAVGETAGVRAFGVASMAETGLLVEAATGQARTPLLPWFDPVAAAQAERLQAVRSPRKAQPSLVGFDLNVMC